MRRAIAIVGVILFLLLTAALGYLSFAPTRIEPVAWTVPMPAPSLSEGPYAANQRLRSIERIAQIGAHGPESLAVAADGSFFTGFEDGRIARFNADGSGYRLVANTGGRPLGVAIHPAGGLVIADAQKGLLRIDPRGAVTVLTTGAEGTPLGFTDDLAIDATGQFVYFSDASSKWTYGHGNEDMLEHAGHGRLLRYDFASGETTVLLRGLQFANGVTLGPRDQFVLVNESGLYRVTRYWLTGERAGTQDIFADNLPGFPDNVRFNGADRIWVAIATPRSALLDGLDGHPTIRKMLGRLLAIVEFQPPPYAMAVAYDLNGRLVANLQSSDPSGYTFLTQVTESGMWLYFSSLAQDGVGRMPLAAALGSNQ